MRILIYWIYDYLYLLKAVLQRHSLQNNNSHSKKGAKKGDIVVISGITIKHHALSHIIKDIEGHGYRVHVIPELGYNFKNIQESAQIVNEFINKNNLSNVILLGYSKGGIVGKYLLDNFNKDTKIKRVISIAAPFSGSSIANLFPIKAFKQISNDSEIIQTLLGKPSLNQKISSIYPVFDNHIWPQGNSYLKGARNIQINVKGHHKVLFHEDTRNAILEEIKSVFEK